MRIAGNLRAAVVPPALGLEELAGLLAGARTVIGVDTGLTHLAAALGVPTVGIYNATDPAATGIYGCTRAVNLGGIGRAPTAQQVIAAVARLRAMSASRFAYTLLLYALLPRALLHLWWRARRQPAYLRARRRAFRALRGCRASAADLGACGVGRRNARGGAADRRAAAPLSATSDPVDAHDADRTRYRRRAVRRRCASVVICRTIFRLPSRVFSITSSRSAASCSRRRSGRT